LLDFAPLAKQTLPNDIISILVHFPFLREREVGGILLCSSLHTWSLNLVSDFMVDISSFTSPTLPLLRTGNSEAQPIPSTLLAMDEERFSPPVSVLQPWITAY
jgi:hypothetical protein